MTNPNHNGRRGVWLPAAAVFIIAAAIRLAHFALVRHAIILEPRGLLDDNFYVTLARQIAAGDLSASGSILGQPGSLPFFLPPLYAYFLGGVFRLFGPGNSAPFVIQAFMGAAAAAIVCRTAQMIAGNDNPRVGLFAGLSAGLLLALDGLAVMYSSTFLAASLDPVLAALCFHAIVSADGRGRFSDWALAGVALGLFALNRPNALLLLPAAAALPFLRRPLTGAINRRAAIAAAALLAAAALTFAPAAIRNYVVSGHFALISSHGGLNFYIGNRSGANGAYSPPDRITPDVRGQIVGTREWLSAELHRPVTDAEVSGLLYRRAFAEMAADPAGWLRLSAVKIRLLLSGREAGLNLALGYMRSAFSPALWAAPVGMWLLLPFGLAGAVAVRRRRPVLIVAGLAAVFGFSVWVFFISDRYRLPLHPPLAVLAGCGLAAVMEAVKGRRRGELALYLCVLAAAGVFAAWPTGVPSGDGQMRLNHALRLIEDGRIGEAETVAAGMPKGAMNPFYWRRQLARAFRVKGAPAAAEAEYRRLLAIDPSQKEIACELAKMLAEQGRTEEAKKMCERL